MRHLLDPSGMSSTVFANESFVGARGSSRSSSPRSLRCRSSWAASWAALLLVREDAGASQHDGAPKDRDAQNWPHRPVAMGGAEDRAEEIDEHAGDGRPKEGTNAAARVEQTGCRAVVAGRHEVHEKYVGQGDCGTASERDDRECRAKENDRPRERAKRESGAEDGERDHEHGGCAVAIRKLAGY